jgi:hypothetical protein
MIDYHTLGRTALLRTMNWRELLAADATRKYALRSLRFTLFVLEHLLTLPAALLRAVRLIVYRLHELPAANRTLRHIPADTNF